MAKDSSETESAADGQARAELATTPEKHPFFDRALDDFLSASMGGTLTAESLESALRDYHANAPGAAPELVRKALGIPVLIGYYYVHQGEVSKKEVLETAPAIIFETAEQNQRGGFAQRLAETAEARWHQGSNSLTNETSTVEALNPDDRQRSHQLILRRFRGGDEEAYSELADQFKPYIHYLRERYYGPDMEPDDIVQEARIGLMKAMHDYKPQRSSFKYFAELAMLRQVITAVKSSTRKKHGPVNEAVSLSAPVNEDTNISLEETLPTPNQSNPAELCAQNEKIYRALRVAAWETTELEQEAILGVYKGYSYGELAASLGVTRKTIDNAIERARTKISRSQTSD